MSENSIPPKYNAKYRCFNDLKIESKEDVKKRLGCSPDKADSFVLTFARLVADPNVIRRTAGVIETDTNWSVF